jgi:hypothetical protein
MAVDRSIGDSRLCSGKRASHPPPSALYNLMTSWQSDTLLRAVSLRASRLGSRVNQFGGRTQSNCSLFPKPFCTPYFLRLP